MNKLNEAQLEFVKHMVKLAKEAFDYEYNQESDVGLPPHVIGRVMYDTAVKNPIVVLETYEALFKED